MIEVLITGIGGQGAQTIGKILIEIYFKKQYKISYYPFYGSQMRGGNSSCVVKFDEREVVNPCINNADLYAAMDENGINENIKYLKHNSIMIINVDKVSDEFLELLNNNNEFKSKNINIIKINANKKAIDFGMKNAANIVMLKYISDILKLSSDEVKYGIDKFFRDNGKQKYIDKNIELYEVS